MKRKVGLGLVLALIAISLPAPVAVGQGQVKVDVCHFVDEYWDFSAGDEEYGVIISIADTAYDAHLAHGDPAGWVRAYLPDGREVCRKGWYVFATSEKFTGDLMGVEGADGICEALAAAAGLPGEYMAWIATNYWDDPESRFKKTDLPYALVDGTLIADGWSDLVDGTLTNPIMKDEYGEVVSGWGVWTNVEPNGASLSMEDCSNWSLSTSVRGRIGHNRLVDGRWTSIRDRSCDITARLYCFQQSD